MADDSKINLYNSQDFLIDDRIAHVIKDVTHIMVRSLQKKLNDYDVPFSHWAILRILWKQDGMSQRELSTKAGVMEPTTANIVQQMEVKGHITRRYLGSNKRKRHVFLTKQGKHLEHQLVPLAEDVNKIATRGISKKELKLLRSTMIKMIKNLDDKS
ncbi:MAG: MarR family transcriptional regulator [Rhodospirillales bacterium]|jgi:DNA-binding MarR family transcriptional regulator|nr:MarR family transcriptional regulator [Rhodospirillales bacterium]